MSYGAGLYGAGVYADPLPLIGAVIVDGDQIDLDAVSAFLTIRQGRATVWDGPTASSCTLELVGVTSALTGPFTVGVPLRVELHGGAPRFVGTVTDAALVDDSLTIVAAGRLAALGAREVGVGAWPAETWTARVNRILDEAGLVAADRLIVAPPTNPTVAARAAQPVDALTALTAAAETLGAAIVDLPDGRVYVQPLAARTVAAPRTLAPATVLYAPGWSQALAAVNTVRVKYAGGEVIRTDAASETRFGPRDMTLTTDLQDTAAANARGGDLLARRAFPRWLIGDCTLLYMADWLTAPGGAVMVPSMPPSSPSPAPVALIEGWTDNIEGQDWTTVLTLSDPIDSGSVPARPQVPLSTLAAYTASAIAGERIDITQVLAGNVGKWVATYDPAGNATYPWLINDTTEGYVVSAAGSALPPNEGDNRRADGAIVHVLAPGIWNLRCYGSWDGVNVTSVWRSNDQTAGTVERWGVEDQAWRSNVELPTGSIEPGTSAPWAVKLGSGSGGWDSVQWEGYPTRVKGPP